MAENELDKVEKAVVFKLTRGLDDWVWWEIEDDEFRAEVTKRLDGCLEKFQPILHAYRCSDHPDSSPMTVKTDDPRNMKVVAAEFCPFCFEQWLTSLAFGYDPAQHWGQPKDQASEPALLTRPTDTPGM